MKKKIWKKGLAAAIGLVLGIHTAAGSVLEPLTAYGYTVRSATVSATSLNVRSQAGTSNAAVGKLSKGTAVTVTGETTGSDGRLWYQIRFTGSGGSSVTGYVLGTYLSFPVSYQTDGDFESQLTAQGFPESYKDSLRQLHAKYPNWIFEAQQTGLDWNTVIQNEGVVGRNLVHSSSISSYKSTADGAFNWDSSTWTGFDGSTWVAASEDIIRYYMDPRNFLDEAYIFQFMSQAYDPSVQTRDGLAAMLKGTFMEGSIPSGQSASGATGTDSSPGTGETQTGPGGSSSGSTPGTPGGQSAVIVAPGASGSSGSGGGSGSSAQPETAHPEVRFQGPQASISPHSAWRVASSVITAGSGGVSQTPGGTGEGWGGASLQESGSASYVDVIMNAAEQSGVSPYIIAATILQEQGSNGSGNSISGNYAGYTGYYNYFNVGAYASDGMGAVERGLWYASQSGSYGRPWTTPEKSILGGAQFYGANYVSAGQDTLYLKKYNVQGSNMYKHQYMTNVEAAASEGSIFAEGYAGALKQTALRFKIPVYSNMPDTACAKPTRDGNPNNKLKLLSVEGFTLTPTFGRDTVSYDLIVDNSVSSVNVSASAIDSGATVSGAGIVQIQNGINEIVVTVKAANGDERSYTIRIVRQAGGPTYSGGNGTGSALQPGTSSGTGSSSGTSSVPGTGSSPGSSGTPGTGNAPGSGSGGTSSSPVIIIGG